MKFFWICWLSVLLCAQQALAQDGVDEKGVDETAVEETTPKKDAEPTDGSDDDAADEATEGGDTDSGTSETEASEPPDGSETPVDEVDGPGDGTDENDSPFKTDQQKTSYAIGVSIGRGLKRDEADVDGALVARGIVDALKEGDVLLTNDQIKELVMAYQKLQREKFISEQAAAAEAKAKEFEEAKQDPKADSSDGKVEANNEPASEPANDAADGTVDGAADGTKAPPSSAAFLHENGKKEGVVTQPSGLQYKILKEGDGPKPKATDTVKVHYRGTLIDGTEFDSSLGGDPLEFRLDRVVKGWTQGLQLMPVGSKWMLYLPSELGYGENPPGRSGIKPGDALIFEVELLEIK
ncbi:MAG: FKBP-type peptidyl-prolyl cis-trans isomerase [Pirellulales bacterium]|nr:FKBP-type peptidyl-prolyl cis-trans isomerase [Pirellulales bacterium]